MPLLLVLLAGCGAEPADIRPGENAGERTLLPLPEEDLSGMEEAPRRRLQALRQRLADGEEASARAWGELGQLYHAYDRFVAAEVCYRNSAQLAPEEASWPYYLSLLEAADGRLEAARNRLETVAVKEPADLPTLLRLGRILLELGRREQAQEAFGQALAIEPQSAAAHDGLARSLPDSPAARDHFLQALAAQPEATILHYRLSQVERRLGNTEAANRHLQALGDSGPGREVRFADPRSDAVARLRIDAAFAVVEELAADPEISEEGLVGYARAQFGDLEGALAAFERYLAAERRGAARADRRQQARVRFTLGVLYRIEGQEGRARPELEAALDLDPELTPARLQLAESLLAAGSAASASEQVRHGLERTPEDPGLRSLLADLLAEAGRFDEAAAELERVLAARPEEGEAHLRLGVIESRRGRLEAAAEHYRLALDHGQGLSSSRRALAARRLGQLQGSRGEVAAAAASFRLAVELDPDSAAAWLAEGTALILAGEHRLARSRLETAVSRHPDHPELARTLARHLAACPVRDLRDGERALELIGPLLRNGGGTLADRETGAMALAESGDFAAAAELQRQLIVEASAGGSGAEVSRLRANLEAYEQERPCCGA